MPETINLTRKRKISSKKRLSPLEKKKKFIKILLEDQNEKLDEKATKLLEDEQKVRNYKVRKIKLGKKIKAKKEKKITTLKVKLPSLEGKQKVKQQKYLKQLKKEKNTLKASASKRVRASHKKYLKNRSQLRSYKTFVKKLKYSKATEPKALTDILNKSISMLDKLSKNNILHRNNIARKKSKLTKWVHKKIQKTASS